MNIFSKLKAWLKLYNATMKAEQEHRKTGERYYVMPTSGTSGQLIIMDRTNFRKLKQKAYINRKASVTDLEKECFYHTPYRNGCGEISENSIKAKKEQYYAWLENIRKIKKNGEVRKH